MKKVMTTTIAAAMLAGSAMASGTLGLDFANTHIFRGYTVADDFVVQPTAELSGFGMPEEYGAFTLGAWASAAPFSDNQDTIYETDWYLAYTLPELVEGMDLYLGLTKYMYAPIQGTPNESELNLGIGYDISGFALGASANFMLDDRNPYTENQIYLDFVADYTLEINEDLDGAVGGLISWIKQGDLNGSSGIGGGNLDDGFNHFELYGALDYALGEMWSVGGKLAYIGQFDDKVLPDAGPSGIGGYENSVLLSIGFGCEM